jgi:hypothetical protein
VSLDQNVTDRPVAGRHDEFAQLGADLAGIGVVELVQDGDGALPGVTG